MKSAARTWVTGECDNELIVGSGKWSVASKSEKRHISQNQGYVGHPEVNIREDGLKADPSVVQRRTSVMTKSSLDVQSEHPAKPS